MALRRVDMMPFHSRMNIRIVTEKNGSFFFQYRGRFKRIFFIL